MTGINIGQADGKLTRNGLQALMDLYSEGLFLFVRRIVRSNETAEELVSYGVYPAFVFSSSM